MDEINFLRCMKDISTLGNKTVTVAKDDFLVLLSIAELVTNKMEEKCINYPECKDKINGCYNGDKTQICKYFIDKKEARLQNQASAQLQVPCQ